MIALPNFLSRDKRRSLDSSLMRRASVLGRSVVGERTANIDSLQVYGDDTPLVDAEIEDAKCSTIQMGGVTCNAFSTDGTFAANSDSKLPTEQAVKEYVDASIGSTQVGLLLNPIEEIYDNTLGLPANIVAPPGDSQPNYVALVDGNGWLTKHYYHDNGVTFDHIIPVVGNTCFNKHENYQITFNGFDWIHVAVSIDHVDLMNKGVLTHAEIDTRLGQNVSTTASPAFVAVSARTVSVVDAGNPAMKMDITTDINGMGILNAVGGFIRTSPANVLYVEDTTDCGAIDSAALVVQGGASIAKQLRVGKPLTVEDVTDSTSSATGSAVFKGGASVQKQLRVGGVTTVSESVSIARTLT